MKVKALLLIFLVIFAAAATSIVLGLSTDQATEENVGSFESYSVEQVYGEVDVGPNGEEMDGPGMPT